MLLVNSCVLLNELIDVNSMEVGFCNGVGVCGRLVATNQDPRREDIAEAMETKPTLMQRKKVIPRITDKMRQFVEVFYQGL